jgi:hypothetical protein
MVCLILQVMYMLYGNDFCIVDSCKAFYNGDIIEGLDMVVVTAYVFYCVCGLVYVYKLSYIRW